MSAWDAGSRQSHSRLTLRLQAHPQLLLLHRLLEFRHLFHILRQTRDREVSRDGEITVQEFSFYFPDHKFNGVKKNLTVGRHLIIMSAWPHFKLMTLLRQWKIKHTQWRIPPYDKKGRLSNDADNCGPITEAIDPLLFDLLCTLGHLNWQINTFWWM